ncbi:LpqB family beta-propeller domain-containing protein [Glaciihabitans sp. dw_435]|uniref:LpqB family beta-propeller domain-containing protein n=1 Tax=Glaciihabitans sp. dw_435 TaxID=2720081 RepID=UPI001BD5CA9B|nr:LpqB family beta-propeller domain-containing protein [Glaciihabitans sp. dw_435]
MINAARARRAVSRRGTRRPGARRIATAALALITAVILAGCVGIPSSGQVNGGGVITEIDDFPFAVLPSGPQQDATQQEILTDFMQAATSPEGNYEIAKQFLTADAAEKWNPNAHLLIREGSATLVSRGDAVVDYSVSTRAQVDSFGQYTELRTAGSTRLSFRFVKVAGQWRISELAPGTVLSRDNFNAVFASHALYFFDPSYRYLIPDVRWFPARSSIATRIVSALLGGQASWLQGGGTLTAFPQGTELATVPVDVRSGLATVDLSKEAGAASAVERARMQQQLLASLGTVSVSTLTMTVRGAPLTVANPGLSNAAVTPDVDSAPLVRKDDKFGFATVDGIDSVSKLSSQIVAVGARAVTMARGQTTAAVLGAAGVYIVKVDMVDPKLLDPRKDLIAPSLDVSGYVWSVPADNPAAIHATGADGVVHEITSGLPAAGKIVSLDVSSDGARLLAYLQTDAGPRLQVAAILRRDGVPTALGATSVDLPVSAETPVDATWVDDRTVATLSTSANGQSVTSFAIGGPSESLGRADGAVSIVGGGGTDQIRVLTSTGTVLQSRASGWQNTFIAADFLATQQ